MDNHSAEQALRMPVAGRRSFYGSGRIWSAELAVLMMGWIKTRQRWKLNPHVWLTAYRAGLCQPWLCCARGCLFILAVGDEYRATGILLKA